MTAMDPTRQAWFDRAKAVRIEDECARRNIKLLGRGPHREGPCPLCGGDDRFSINTAKQVFRCRQCNEKGGDIIDMVVWLDRCEFEEAVGTLARQPPPEKVKPNGHDSSTAKSRRVATWIYRDADGKPYLKVDRLEQPNGKKDYPQSYWDGACWRTGKPKGAKIPYRLPELLDSDRTEPIWITEGEKCADAVAGLGLAATSASEGAGKWTPDLNEWFRDRLVYVLPDNDKQGARHAEQVAHSLAGIAQEIRIINLPGLAAGEDAYDWIGRGGTREQLDELGEAASTFQATQEPGRSEAEDRSGEGREADDDIGDDDKASAADDEQIKADRKVVKSALDAAIDDMNLKYCVVNDGGSVLIFMDRFDEALERRVYDRMRQGSLMLLHANEKICTSVSPEGKRTYKPLASVWLSNKRRRDYKKGVVFDPTTTESRNGKLNLWRSFGYEPKRGRWGLMKEHLRTIVCGGEETYFDYLMGWMACAVQHPADQGEVAVVLRGGKGVGKGILGHALRKIFGQHGMYISQSKHLVGAFNAHLRDCVLLFADEAFFAGDKPAEGTLKALITEETLTIESKGQNVILSKNHLHTIMASNEKRVIPASLDERRFFVLDVSGAKQGDLPYFKAIIKELESGGYAAMLHDLLKHDISSFDVRHIPATAALDDQKKLTMPSEIQWWHGVLLRGYVYRSKYGLENHFGQWHDFMSTDVLYDAYMDHAKSRNDRYRMAPVSFGKFMNGLGCKPVRSGGADVIGEHQVRSDYDGILRAELIKKDRPRGYRIGTLEQARTEFENYTGLSFTWEPEEEQTDEDPS